MGKNLTGKIIKGFVALMGAIVIFMVVFGFFSDPHSVQSDGNYTREELQLLPNDKLRLEITRLSNSVEYYQSLKQQQLDTIEGIDQKIIENRSKIEQIKHLIFGNECKNGITYNKDCSSFTQNQ